MSEFIHNWWYFLVFLALWFVFQKLHLRRAARKTLGQQQSLYSTRHEYVEVSPQQFPWLDLPYYDDTRRRLENAGFRWLTDREDVTVTRTFPSMRTFIRVMVSADGGTLASCYHFKNRSIFMKLLLAIARFPSQAKIIDMESQFTVGSFAVTSNTREMDRTTEVPGIARNQLPLGTPVEEVLRVHTAALRDVTSRYPDLTLVQVTTAEEALEFQHRLQETKNAHKQKIGYITGDDIVRMGGNQRSTAEKLAREVEKLKQG